MQIPSLIQRLASLSVSACLLVAVWTGANAAAAGAAGILPPANPAADCDHANAQPQVWGIAGIDRCRALEGVGPLILPSNWQQLTPVQQGFVLINLERVNRGLPPIIGLSAALNQLASAGAAQNNDPSFPSGGFLDGGAIWAGTPSVLAADYLWMYDDGPNGLNSNLACPSAGASGCWGHRDIILLRGTSSTLVAGGGRATVAGNGSYAYLVLDGYSTADLTFTWASELRYFSTGPTLEPLGKVAKATRPHRRRHRRPRRHHHRPLGGPPTITFS